MKHYSNYQRLKLILISAAYLLTLPVSWATSVDPFVAPQSNCALKQQLSSWRVIGLVGNATQGWLGWLANQQGEWWMIQAGQSLFNGQTQVKQITPSGIELLISPLARCQQKTLFLPLLWQSAHSTRLAKPS